MATFFYSPAFDTDRVAAVEKRIRMALPSLKRITQLSDFPQSTPVGAEKNYLLVAAFGTDNSLLSVLLDFAVSHREQGFLILIDDDISASDYKRLLRTGAADWVAAGAVPQDIIEIITRREGANQSERRTPIVISFVPSAGGVGNTSLAVEVATSLTIPTPKARRNICLVDLDFQNSHVCDYLDIDPRLKIQEISNNPNRLDDQLLDIYVSRHASGLHIFAAPRSKINLCDLNMTALDVLFNRISFRYDMIVIDFPVTWFSWTFQIIAGSDGIILSGLNTVPGLRQLADTAAVIREAKTPSAAMVIVLNRCKRGFLGGIERRHHVKKVLSRERVFFVRDDPAFMESANTGIPVSIGGAARKPKNEIEALVQFCAGLTSSRVLQRKEG